MEKDLKPSIEQLEPTAPPWVSEPLGQPDKPLTAGEPEREVDMESLLPEVVPARKPALKKSPPGLGMSAKNMRVLRAARKMFWARFQLPESWPGVEQSNSTEVEELEATMEKYAGKAPALKMQAQPEPRPRPNPKLWIRIKLDAKKHEPFFVEANCTKFTQDQGDLRLELVVNLENMKKLVGNYGKAQLIGTHSLVRQLAVSDIEILRSGKGKRSWLIKSPKQRKISFEIQNLTTEMLPSRLFRLNLRCSKV